MAKDNQRKTSDPGTAKKKPTQSKASQAQRPKDKARWRKEHWVSFAIENGVDPTGKKVSELKSELKSLKNYDGRVNNGGHENSGRKPQDELPIIHTAVSVMEEHIMEIAEVKFIKDPTAKNVKYSSKKVSTLVAMLDQLRMDGLNPKNTASERVKAIEAYMDRILGKAKQAIELSGSIKAEEQELPTPEEQAAAAAYERALEAGLPVASPISQM